MGVHNLWELLSPVGRRVSVETLAGKRVAIDASIWIIQFMKAMRDEKGEMVRNAHLIGFFRRICKLLFLRTKPVFVFDGGTPALKRRTVIARRRQRENAQLKIRKTAEKLLMNQLKSMKLKQLADDLKNQRKDSDVKGKKVLSAQTEAEKSTLERNDTAPMSYNQEKMDEMLAASLAAEEDGSFTRNASTSTAGIAFETEDDDDDEDEEMILPAMPGKVDPAVLASLPPSMQLDLLVQMRERLMAENRQKYQKVKKAPAKFSELQIESYLKTVAFRREIGEVQRSASGRGVGGVQTSRIASESNREFIFSSSFTGDKQAFTLAGIENRENMQFPIRSNSLDTISTVKTSTATTSVGNEPGGGLEDDVETYLDDRGNVRVSRVRAMGIRMTRDLQRNLEMMKEMETERENASEIMNSDISVRDITGAPLSFPSIDQFPRTSNEANNDRDSILNNISQQFVPKYEASIEISFEDNGEQKCSGGDDDIFASLVSGNPVVIPPVLNTSPKVQTHGSDSEDDWEDGVVEDKVSLNSDVKAEIKPSFVERNISDESKVELEEGIWGVTGSVDSPVEFTEAISKGCQEEETDMQEAIRRSMEDLKRKHHVDVSSENGNKKYHAEVAVENPGTKVQSDSFLPNNEPFRESLADIDKHGGVIETSTPTIIINSGSHLASSTTSNSKKTYFGDSEEEIREINLSTEKIIDALNEGGEVSPIDNHFQVNGSFSGLVLNNDLDAILCDASRGGSEFGHKTTESVAPIGDYSAKSAPLTVDAEQSLADVRDKNNFLAEKEDSRAEVTESALEEELLVLDQEFVNLEDEQRRNERNAESVSSEMFSECQELLQMFGLPYIIAPMEAEAQCAYMELAGLVDGVVTDDSDVFLFGARSVYKNIFDDRKYVETYFMKDIETELGLSRDKLIRMALLLGSDYTEGISGIGIVNAIEVVNAFPEEDGFHKFREWIESPDPNIFGKFHGKPGSTSKKRGPSVDENNVNHSDGNSGGVAVSESNQVHIDDQPMDVLNEQRQTFMDKHRNVSKNWHVPSSFPSEAVISAYSSPRVDKSTEPFTWGKPDLNVLRKLCWGKFGWSSQKADELLLPVLKEYNKHETQLRLEAFYTFNEKFARVRSKRIKKAVKGIIGNQSSEDPEASLKPSSKTRKKRRLNPVESVVNRTEELLCAADDDVAGKESTSISSRKQSGEGVTTPTREGKPQASKQAVGRGRVGDGSSGKSTTRRRGRKQQVGRGRKKGQAIDSAKSSSSDGDSSNDVLDEMSQEPYELRRSSRSRNPVDYSANDLEFDEVENIGGEEYANKQSMDQEPSSLCDLSEDESRTIFVDPLPQNAVCENLCEIGNEGCMNEDEIGELNANQIGDETDYANDYLTMGGGFCMDEDATDESLKKQANNSASAATAEITADYHFFDSADKTEHQDLTESVCRREQTSNDLQLGRSTETSSVTQNLNFVNDTSDVSNVAVLAEENTKDHNNATSVGALSAMPLLRRKKRKS